MKDQVGAMYFSFLDLDVKNCEKKTLSRLSEVSYVSRADHQP